MHVHRADPAYRRRMLVLLALAVLAGGTSLWALQLWLDGSANGDRPNPLADPYWLYVVFAGTSAALALPMVLLGLWLRRYARAVQAGCRHPLADERTARDMPVRAGEDAVAHARRLRRLGSLLWLLATGVIVWSLWTGWRLG